MMFLGLLEDVMDNEKAYQEEVSLKKVLDALVNYSIK